MSAVRSSLARHVQSETTDAEMSARRDELGRRAWHGDGLVVIGVDDPAIPWDLREMADRYGTRKFGARSGAGR